jgi:hypothetical protein
VRSTPGDRRPSRSPAPEVLVRSRPSWGIAVYGSERLPSVRGVKSVCGRGPPSGNRGRAPDEGSGGGREGHVGVCLPSRPPCPGAALARPGGGVNSITLRGELPREWASVAWTLEGRHFGAPRGVGTLSSLSVSAMAWSVLPRSRMETMRLLSAGRSRSATRGRGGPPDRAGFPPAGQRRLELPTGVNRLASWLSAGVASTPG